MQQRIGKDGQLFNSFLGAVLLVLLPVAVFVYEQVSGHYLSDYGLLPRNLSGLRGIFFMPFLHGDLSHLLSNMSALFVLSWLGIYTFKRLYWGMLLFVWLASGTWTWIFARPDYHIGASGIVYGVAIFSLVSGFLSKNKSLQGLTLLTAFLYGGFIWGAFPWEYTRDISWEGHLAGAVAGLAVALVMRTEFPKDPVYSWDIEPEPEIIDPEEAYWELPEEKSAAKPDEPEQSS